MITFRWAGASDTGQVRSANQDRWHATNGLFVVADGMGGHQGGEVASAVAIETMREEVLDADGRTTTERLLDGVQAANRAVITRSHTSLDLRGMGTTLSAVAAIDGPDADEQWLAVANVGDSRVYLWAGDELRQITRDHSLVEDLVRDGRLTEEEAAVHPQRNILTRALGVSGEIDVDYWELPARDGDRLLLCSDGLFNEVSIDQIASVLRRLGDPVEVAEELVRLANVGGGRDNITVVVADVIEGPTADDQRIIGAPQVRQGRSDLAGFTSARDGDTAEHAVLDAAGIPARLLASATEIDDDDIDPGRSRTPIRTLGWLVSLAVVITVVIVAVGLYSRSSYFVGVDDDSVVIFQGRPGGVLWFDPTVELVTEVDVGDLTPLLLEEVQGNPDYASVEGALEYVDGLAGRLAEAAVEPEPDE